MRGHLPQAHARWPSRWPATSARAGRGRRHAACRRARARGGSARTAISGWFVLRRLRCYESERGGGSHSCCDKPGKCRASGRVGRHRHKRSCLGHVPEASGERDASRHAAWREADAFAAVGVERRTAERAPCLVVDDGTWELAELDVAHCQGRRKAAKLAVHLRSGCRVVSVGPGHDEVGWRDDIVVGRIASARSRRAASSSRKARASAPSTSSAPPSVAGKSMSGSLASRGAARAASWPRPRARAPGPLGRPPPRWGRSCVRSRARLSAAI